MFSSKKWNQLKNTILSLTKSFLISQKDINPLIYFIWFAFSHSVLYQTTKEIEIQLYLTAIAILVTTKHNILYAFAPVLHFGSLWTAALMLAVGLITSNERWKLLLFLMTVGCQIFNFFSYQSQFILLYSLFLSYYTFKSLPFKSINQNYQYFTGFFATAALQIYLQFWINFLQKQSSILANCLILAMFGLTGYKLMNCSLNNLLKLNMQEVSGMQLMAHYLKLLQSSIKMTSYKKAKISRHTQSCQKVTCFCKNTVNQKNIDSYFFRQLYQDSVKKYNDCSNHLLFQNYIYFLLQNDQIINALHFLIKWNTQSISAQLSKMRCIASIQIILQNQNSSLSYAKQFKYALNYDRHCHHLSQTINQILNQKLVFWQEASQQAPLLTRLQKEGNQITEKMYDLNQFYNTTLKKYQKCLFSLDATVYYAMYLFSTTNFIEYAQNILKHTQKRFQTIAINDKQFFQTFAIRVKVESKRTCFMHKKNISSKLQQIDDVKSYMKQDKHYKLLIDRVSDGFCKLIDVSKPKILGCELKQLIPHHYKEIHDQRLHNLLNFQNQTLNPIVPSKILHRELKLPIKGKDTQLFIGQICIKVQSDIEEGLSFVSILRLSNQKMMTAIVDFDGRVSQKQQGFNQQILSHSQIIKYLQKLRKQWIQYKAIRQQLFTLAINNIVHQVKISSPLMGLFLDKEDLTNIYPPFHIEILNTEGQQLHKLQNIKSNLIKKLKLKKDSTSSRDSISNQLARDQINCSTISILTKYCQKKQVPVYRCILVTFLLVLLFCMSAILTQYLSSSLSWDNTSSQDNPIYDTITMMRISLKTLQMGLKITDLNALNNKYNQIANLSQINKYQGVTDYKTRIGRQLLDMYQSLMRYKQQISVYQSSLLQNQISLILAKKIEYQIYTRGTANPMFKTMDMTYLELISNYIVDLDVIYINSTTERTVLEKTFDQQIVSIQNVTYFKLLIDDSIDAVQNYNILLSVSLSVLVVGMIIPLVITLKQRLMYEFNIFDLIVSVSSSLVHKQIKKLKYVISTLKYSGDDTHSDGTKVLVEQQTLKLIEQFSQMGNSQDINNNQIKLADDNQIKLADNNTIKLANKNRSNTDKMILGDASNPFMYLSSISFLKCSNLKNNKSAKLRKRAGQINPKYSDCDPHKKIRSKHMVIYILIVLYGVFIALNQNTNQSYMEEIKNQKDILAEIFIKLINKDIVFLMGKDYFRTGKVDSFCLQPSWGYTFPTTTSVNGVDPNTLFLRQIIQRFADYDNGVQTDFQKINQNCQNTYSFLNTTNLATYCQNKYSYLTLQGQFYSLLKIASQFRYNRDKKMILMSYGLIPFSSFAKQFQINLSNKAFYLQSLNDQIQQKLQTMASVMQSHLLQTSKQYQVLKLNQFIFAIAWTIITLLIGLWLIISMRNQYLRDVYMLNFLNRQMFGNNKRIQSFVQTLNKAMGGK